ncbi:hypothetical protein HanIR_Chr15g0781091 [Helianthus annuus]|nr:hypothetical protein HanIR_Chr15g0781091 [Helianthus annuus]
MGLTGSGQVGMYVRPNDIFYGRTVEKEKPMNFCCASPWILFTCFNPLTFRTYRSSPYTLLLT